MTLRQFAFKSSLIGGDTDSVEKREKYEAQKEKLIDLLYANLNVRGISFMSDGRIEIVVENDSIGKLEKFITDNGLDPAKPTHTVLTDSTHNDIADEKLEQDSNRPLVSLKPQE